MKNILSFLPLALPFLFVAVGIGYVERYSLGLVDPKFQKGDCAEWVYENEFERRAWHELILEVGEERYLTVAIYDGRVSSITSTDSISSFDSQYSKIDCSKVK